MVPLGIGSETCVAVVAATSVGGAFSTPSQSLYPVARGTAVQEKATGDESGVGPVAGLSRIGRRLSHVAGTVNVERLDSSAGQAEKNATTHHSITPDGTGRVRWVSSVSPSGVGTPSTV